MHGKLAFWAFSLTFLHFFPGCSEMAIYDCMAKMRRSNERLPVFAWFCTGICNLVTLAESRQPLMAPNISHWIAPETLSLSQKSPGQCLGRIGKIRTKKKNKPRVVRAGKSGSRNGGKRRKRRLWFCNQPFGKISVMIIISLHSFLTSKACQWQHVTDEMSFKKCSQLLNGESHIGQTHLKMTTRAVAIHLKHQLLYKRHLEHQPL